VNEPTFDSNLWFTMGTCWPGKHYLLHSAHTFPDRMRAWCPTKKITFSVSKSAMGECSAEARNWVQGFLAGNEPDAPRDEKGNHLPDDHPRLRQWRAAIQQFPETSLWVVQDWVCEECGEKSCCRHNPACGAPGASDRLST
jgi:hypothetical protein